MMLALANSLVAPNVAALNNSMTYLQKYMGGTSAAALHGLKASLNQGQDGAAVFVGDSTFRDAAALPFQFATALAARYPTHRVVLEQAANNMESITTTVIGAGPSGERYIEFDASPAAGNAVITPTLQRVSLDGKTGFRVEVGFSLPAGKLNGSGWPTSTAEFTGFGPDGNRSVFYLTTSGILTIQGHGVGAASANITCSAAIAALTADTRFDVRVDFTATNGSNALATFYTSTDGGVTWNQLGTADRTGTAITITHAAGNFYIGNQTGTSLASLRFYRVQWYSTTTTPVPVLPERIDQWSPVVGYTKPLTALGGSPTIYVSQAAQDGATLAANGFFTGSGAGDLATEAYRCLRDHLPAFVQIASSHNDGVALIPDWEGYMDSAVTVVNNWFFRDPAILHTTQNPGDDSGSYSEILRQHQQRQKDILVYATKKGRGCTDIYQAWVDANNSGYDIADNVHPSAAGYAFWGQVFFRLFQAA